MNLRFLFGSVIDTICKKEENDELYIIQDILLHEQHPNGIISSSSLELFINSDIKNLQEMPSIYYTPLSNKKLKSSKSSLKFHLNDDSIDEDEDEEEDSNEEDEDTDDDEPFIITKV